MRPAKIFFQFNCQTPGEQTLQDTALSAIRQIVGKQYAAALETECSRDRIRIYGFAFRGKEVRIDGGSIHQYENLK